MIKERSDRLDQRVDTNEVDQALQVVGQHMPGLKSWCGHIN